jgi:hypothetical protein
MDERSDKSKPAFIRPTEEQMRDKTTQAGTFQTLYANQVRLAPSFYDIRVFFGQSSMTPKGEQTFEEQVAVVMSPECAKALVTNLLIAVQKYEELFGNIRSLPNLTESSSVIESGVSKRTKKQ